MCQHAIASASKSTILIDYTFNDTISATSTEFVCNNATVSNAFERYRANSLRNPTRNESRLLVNGKMSVKYSSLTVVHL